MKKYLFSLSCVVVFACKENKKEDTVAVGVDKVPPEKEVLVEKKKDLH